MLLAAYVAVRFHDANLWNHDVAWFLYCAERILDGARYYRDWLDVNPPGISWLSVIPVALARALGVSSMLAFDALVVCAILLSVVASHRILRGGWPDTAPRVWLALCAGSQPRSRCSRATTSASASTSP